MIEDIEFGKEIILGSFAGVLFILLNVTFGLVIGTPLLAFAFDSQTEKYMITDVIAPSAEELVFRALLPFTLVVIGVPIFLNFLLNIPVFALFHYVVYGESIKAGSSLFIGAGVFAAMAFALTYYKSNSNDFQIPLAAILAHAIVNTWLGIRALGLIIVGT